MVRSGPVSDTPQRSRLSCLGLEDTVGDLREVAAHDVRALHQGIEHHPLARDEGRRATGAQCPRHIPGVGGDEADLADLDAEALRGHAVRLGSWFEAFNRIGGEDLLEVAAQPGALHLGLGDLLRGVRQRGQTEPRVAQAVQAPGYLRVRRQLAHTAQDPLPLLLGEVHALALGDHVERGATDRTEIRVGAGHRRNQGGLQELQEPGPPYPGVAEEPLEVGVECPEVQQRLVDVEDANPRHAPSLFLPAYQRGVVDHYAAVHDDGQAVLSGVGRRLLVYYAGLHPQGLRPRLHGVLSDGHNFLASAEHVHDVYGFGHLFERGVRFLAEDWPAQVGVDGEDPEPEVLEGPRYGVAGAVRSVREPDDRDGARACEQGPYLLRAGIFVHRVSL